MKQMQHVTRTKQQTIQALIDSNTEFYCWFLADGSPRVGKDFLLCELYVLTRADMADCLYGNGYSHYFARH